MRIDQYRMHIQALLHELLLRLGEDHGNPSGLSPEEFAEEMSNEFLDQLENDAFEGDEPLGAMITIDDIMLMLDYPPGTSQIQMRLRNLAYAFFDQAKNQEGWDY